MLNNCLGHKVSKAEAKQMLVRYDGQDRRRNHEIPEHREIVEAGGGEYVRGMLGDLVLFNSRQTGSTLAVPVKDLTAEEVVRKILLSNAAFRK